MPKFCIFNDRFSSNLGDGVIAECLEAGLRRFLPQAALRTIDLGGRAGPAHDNNARYGSAGEKLRQVWFNAPAFARRAVAWYRVDHRFRAYVTELSAGADAFVIGGGQLITGKGVFFPHRLATIASVARERGIPLFVHAVGVSDPAGWQEEAIAHLEGAFRGADLVQSVATRDRLSADHWSRAFGGITPSIARDPGLLAGEVYAGLIRDAGHRSGSKEIGIGVISAHVVDWFDRGLAGAVKPSLDFFADVGARLLEAGHRPVYFTNGSGEDEAALEALAEHVARYRPNLRRRARFLRRPATAAALARTIAGLDGLIAHRLHANIVAYALGIPHVGLGWDEKLASFFRSVGREHYLLGGGGRAGADGVRLIGEAMREGIAREDRADVVAETWNGVGALARRLVGIGQEAEVA